MSLRLKLLLMSLATLVLPWAGCQYAREMESALRAGEKEALGAMAQTIAASLQGRSDLLYRDSFSSGAGKPGPLDLQPMLLAGEPFLDGYPEEWPDDAPNWRTVSRGKERVRILTGVHERTLYMLLDVRDDRLVFDAPAADPLESASLGDRIWIGFQDPQGIDHHVFIASGSAGAVRARRIETREFGHQVAVEEPRIEGALQPVNGGYRAELRIPMSLLGPRLGVLIDDRDKRGAAPESFGTLGRDDLRVRGRLVAAAPALHSYLEQFIQPGLRLSVTTPEGTVLGVVDALGANADFDADRGILSRLYRRLLANPGEREVLEASRRILDHDRRQLIGHLQIAQTAERWLTRRDRALTNLLNFTLLTSAVAVLGMFAFAAHLAFRLARLRRASESALTREGLVTTFPETNSPDELGDMARSFSTLLARLGEYTGYLRTLAGKLAHEIRTPLTIVRSSLENLESEGISPGARVYLERAREGSGRLNAILVAMGAATRVEEAIQNAERTRFDTAPVIQSAVESYRSAFPQRQFAAELPGGGLEIEGAPDLIVQMLDKLVDNAVDFSPEGATITVRLREEPQAAIIEVDNPGPTIPPQVLGRLFESLWQSRSGSDSRPHFGLGLYIVRLIAEFHNGGAQAQNLPDGSGARFSVWLAR
jgi:signal transduction histidine kinase